MEPRHKQNHEMDDSSGRVPGSLLAVDAGLRTGLALFAPNGRLRWCRSKNFGSGQALRRGVHTILNDLPGLEGLVVEGGGPVAAAWTREARRRGIDWERIGADDWRVELLLVRERTSAIEAKEQAGHLARRIIHWSGLSQPSSLRHDAAEAVCLGLWQAVRWGWVDVAALNMLRRL